MDRWIGALITTVFVLSTGWLSVEWLEPGPALGTSSQPLWALARNGHALSGIALLCFSLVIAGRLIGSPWLRRLGYALVTGQIACASVLFFVYGVDPVLFSDLHANSNWVVSAILHFQHDLPQLAALLSAVFCVIDRQDRAGILGPPIVLTGFLWLFFSQTFVFDPDPQAIWAGTHVTTARVHAFFALPALLLTAGLLMPWPNWRPALLLVAIIPAAAVICIALYWLGAVGMPQYYADFPAVYATAARRFALASLATLALLAIGLWWARKAT